MDPTYIITTLVTSAAMVAVDLIDNDSNRQ
jgi:hypothetical protein